LSVTGLTRELNGPDRLNGSDPHPRARARSKRPPPPATTPTAFPTTAALRGGTVGFVSTRRSERHPPRQPPGRVRRRRGRRRCRKEAALEAARRTSTVVTEESNEFTWRRRWFGRRAAACGATAAENGCEAARGDGGCAVRRRWALGCAAACGDGVGRCAAGKLAKCGRTAVRRAAVRGAQAAGAGTPPFPMVDRPSQVGSVASAGAAGPVDLVKNK
jgi:hypothetical protein